MMTGLLSGLFPVHLFCPISASLSLAGSLDLSSNSCIFLFPKLRHLFQFQGWDPDWVLPDLSLNVISSQSISLTPTLTWALPHPHTLYLNTLDTLLYFLPITLHDLGLPLVSLSPPT